MHSTWKLSLSGALIVSMALSVWSAESVPQTSPALSKVLGKARALMEEGKYEAAINRLKKAETLTTNPPVHLLLDLAVCFNSIGEFSTSETYARRGLENSEEPADRASALNHLGISLYGQARLNFRSGAASGEEIGDQLDEAESAFREVLELTDGQAVPWYNLAEVLKLRGRRPEAKDAFAEYLERSPDGAHAAAATRALEWITCVQSISASDDSSKDVPMQVGGEVLPPVKIHAPQPSYSDKARRAGVQGTMVFEAIIDKNGDVRCLDVVRSLPLGLGEAAASAVKQWKFEPATLHGEPVVVSFHVQISMSMRR